MRQNIKKLILLFITCIFLYFVFVNLDIKKLLEIINSFNLQYIILVILFSICSQTFRGLCFKLLISKTVNLPLKEAAQLCITGSALNIILPARAGDLFRAFYTGQKYNTSKVKIFGSIMLERLFDIFIIFCFLFLGVSVYKKNQLASDLCMFAGICIIIGIIVCIISYKYNNIDKICNYLTVKISNISFGNIIKNLICFINKTCNSFFNGFEIIESPKKVIYTALASLSIWIFEGICYLCVIYGFGYHIHWSISLFIICFIALACMIPSTSIFIGPNQLAVIMAFSLYNINKETALAISIVEQITVTLTAVTIAGIFLLKNNISFKQLKEDIKKD